MALVHCATQKHHNPIPHTYIRVSLVSLQEFDKIEEEEEEEFISPDNKVIT